MWSAAASSAGKTRFTQFNTPAPGQNLHFKWCTFARLHRLTFTHSCGVTTHRTSALHTAGQQTKRQISHHAQMIFRGWMSRAHECGLDSSVLTDAGTSINTDCILPAAGCKSVLQFCLPRKSVPSKILLICEPSSPCLHQMQVWQRQSSAPFLTAPFLYSEHDFPTSLLIQSCRRQTKVNAGLLH